MEHLRVPQHFRFIIPIIEVLKELGGSGRAGEVTDLVIEKLNIPEEELNETNKNGGSRIKNQIHWARLMLVKTDYLDSSKRGVWSLTEKGTSANLSQQDLLDLYDKRKQLAKVNHAEHARTLFIMNCLYGMYLRISELVADDRWVPTMGDFHRDSEGRWWFLTVGKGNKERKISVSQAMLSALSLIHI